MKMLNETFGLRKKQKTPKPPVMPVFQPKVLAKKRELEQEHLCFGYEAIPYVSSDRYGMYALNSIFGNSMSSRLFQEVREKHGLAYSVYSYLTQLRDTGLFTIYAAVSPAKTQQLIRVIDKEIKKLRKHGILPDELRKVKDQMKGSIVLGMENTNNRMSQIAKHEIYLGRFISLDEVLASVDAVSVEQVNGLVNSVLDNGNRSLAALGPVDPKVIKAAAG
jgi:predicted Zn-dependent peptidase